MTNKLRERGIQSLAGRKTGTVKSTVSLIFSGKVLCTPAQAVAFEEFFIQKGIPLNRWDLLYGMKLNPEHPKSLAQYLDEKRGTDGEREVKDLYPEFDEIKERK